MKLILSFRVSTLCLHIHHLMIHMAEAKVSWTHHSQLLLVFDCELFSPLSVALCWQQKQTFTIGTVQELLIASHDLSEELEWAGRLVVVHDFVYGHKSRSKHQSGSKVKIWTSVFGWELDILRIWWGRSNHVIKSLKIVLRLLLLSLDLVSNEAHWVVDSLFKSPAHNCSVVLGFCFF